MGIIFSMMRKHEKSVHFKVETFSCTETRNKEMKRPLKQTKRKSERNETAWLSKHSGLHAD